MNAMNLFCEKQELRIERLDSGCYIPDAGSLGFE